MQLSYKVRIFFFQNCLYYKRTTRYFSGNNPLGDKLRSPLSFAHLTSNTTGSYGLWGIRPLDSLRLLLLNGLGTGVSVSFRNPVQLNHLPTVNTTSPNAFRVL